MESKSSLWISFLLSFSLYISMCIVAGFMLMYILEDNKSFVIMGEMDHFLTFFSFVSCSIVAIILAGASQLIMQQIKDHQDE